MIVSTELVKEINSWADRCEHHGQGYVMYREDIDELVIILAKHKVNECTHIIKLDESIMNIVKKVQAVHGYHTD